MATRYAVATGNWSAVGTWDGGTTLPTSSDDVYADGKTVTIDQDVTVLSLRTTARSGGTAGGGFTCSAAYTIDLSAGTGIVPGTTTCLTLSHNTGTVTLKSTISGSSTTAASYGVNITGTGTTTVTGSVSGSTQGTGHGIVVGAAATLNVTGNVTGAGGGSTRGYGLSLGGTASTVSVTGNVTGATNNPGISSTGAATITVVGTITASNDSATAGSIDSTGAAAITITGNVTGSTVGAGCPAVRVTNASATCSIVGTLTASLGPAIAGGGIYTLSGPFVSSATGLLPLQATGIVKLTGITNNEFRFVKSTGGTTSLWSSDVNSGAPSAANVRKGTTFGVSSEFVGTAAIPAAQNVLYGVPVDATTGTASITADKWLSPL